MRRLILKSCSAMLCLTQALAQGLGQEAGAKRPLQKSPTEIASTVGRSTVIIRASLPGGGLSTGSGFIADASGTVVTNSHVVDSAERVEIRVATGDVYEVTGVRAIDRRRDIAILQIPGFGLPTASLGNSDSIQPGDRVVVIGNALGVLENTVTAGIISGVRDFEGYKLFQMDAAISKGNSGGPVVSERGEVVGITVAKIEGGESLNFAIPVNYARGLLRLEPKAGIESLRFRGDADSLFERSSLQFPRRWKSLVSGSVKIVRFEGDFVYVETLMPEQFTTSGGMHLAELEKQGQKWVGRSRSRIPCSTGFRRRLCSFQYAIEITVLTPTRIEGTVEAPPEDAEMECSGCSYGRPFELQGFVWIPE